MILYENFNTSNQTSPHFERHEHFAMETPKVRTELGIRLFIDANLSYILFSLAKLQRTPYTAVGGEMCLH